MKNDSGYIQGIPDLLILYRNKWAALECKKSAKAKRQPNQEYYVQKMDEMSFARFISPENEEEMVRRLVDILTFVIYIWRGDMKMIDMYLALVMNDMRTCDENNKTLPLVPKKYRVKVMECLTALGLDANGDPIA